MKPSPSRPLRIAGISLAIIGLVAVPWVLTHREASKSVSKTATVAAESGISGTWIVAKPVLGVKMQYTLKPDGTYVALLGEMDHQGTYTIKNDKLVFQPQVVAQKRAADFLNEYSKNPDDLDPSELRFMEQLAKPYTLAVASDKDTIAGLGFTAKLDPKADPLF
jgi:hypothetical protein